MLRRTLAVGLVWALLMPLVIGPALKAQEGAQPPVFGPQDILPLFFRALSVADLTLFKDGNVLSATVQTAEFTLTSSTLGTKTFKHEEIVAIAFGDEESASDQIFLKSGDKLVGQLSPRSLEAVVALNQRASLEARTLKTILFKLPPPEEGQPRPGPMRVFTQLFGVFTNLLVSVTKFDILVFPDGRLASVLLDGRDELAFTFQSTFFGTFTFTPAQIAWVVFGDSGQPDQLALKNGDRVFGSITAQQDLEGRLASVPVEFSFSKDQLRQQLRQVMFQIPVRLFGGGGGKPRKPIED